MAFLSCDLVFFILYRLLILVLQAKGGSSESSTCPKSFSCGKYLTDLSFPFSFNSTQQYSNECGLMALSGCDAKPFPRIQLLPGGDWYYALGMPYNYTIVLRDLKLQTTLGKHKCRAFDKNISLPDSPSISFKILTLFNFFKCYSANPNITHQGRIPGYGMYNGCKGFNIYYKLQVYDDGDIQAHNLPSNCSLVQLPSHPISDDGDVFNHQISDDGDVFKMLSPVYYVEWKLSDECNKCHDGGGQCQTDEKTNKFYCYRGKSKGGFRSNIRVLVATVFGGVVLVVITCFAAYFIWCHKRRKFSPSKFLSTKKLSSIFRYDDEESNIYFGVPVFPYSELEEATNGFNSSRVLGDGGFGTVYHGKLKDGRDVAVKRLYEHNCKRMQQFVNEIEILTKLRHNNLATLYGCTSRRSQELLLVYEYIPNGTLGDHLHGDRAKNGSLTWPVRMNIAIETAGALAYMHASDIIHCDVKTNNILLDHNFSVKVADFGISRLFPNDVTHISTAPRGTPGYIDPKYHDCYQLTSKSDVYSFGVVLVELISSLPAVDMNRQTQEINLANFAINKIIKSAFDELIDPSLGFDSDTKIWEMTTSVAELAFLCLQTDWDMRPTMVEALDILKGILENEFEFDKIAEPNLYDNVSESMILLKQAKSLPSPNSVTDKWINTSSDISSATN